MSFSTFGCILLQFLLRTGKKGNKLFLLNWTVLFPYLAQKRSNQHLRKTIVSLTFVYFFDIHLFATVLKGLKSAHRKVNNRIPSLSCLDSKVVAQVQLHGEEAQQLSPGEQWGKPPACYVEAVPMSGIRIRLSLTGVPQRLFFAATQRIAITLSPNYYKKMQRSTTRKNQEEHGPDVM